MNNDHWSQGRETGRHGKPYSGAAKNWLLLRVTALFVAKGRVLGSLRKAVLLSLWKEGMEKKEKQERAVHSSKEKG